jgi:hypothetical protein
MKKLKVMLQKACSYFLFFLFMPTLVLCQNSTSKYSLDLGIAVGNESNLGDAGVHTTTRLGFNLSKKAYINVGFGSFQAIKANEKGLTTNLKERTLHFSLSELGLGLDVIQSEKIFLRVDINGVYRNGRSLYPQITSSTSTIYKYEKITGLGLGTHISVGKSVSKNTFIGLKLGGYTFDYFGELLSLGLILNHRL